MPTGDRRVQRTRRALRSALISLLARKDLSRISVRELADAADINRVTFYAHYEDIYALYESLGDEVIERLGTLIASHPEGDYRELFADVSALMGEKRWMYVLLTRDGALRGRLVALLEERLLEIYAHDNPGLTITNELRTLVTYHVSGLMAIVARWAHDGFRGSEAQVASTLALADQAFDAGLRQIGVI